MSYSRELDDIGEATEKIEDKSSYHFMDAERYMIGWLRRKGRQVEVFDYRELSYANEL